MTIIPPYDLEAEQSLLGAMMIDEAIIPYTVSQLKSAYFYSEENSYIFKAIAFLKSKNKNVDLVTVKDQLTALEIEVKNPKFKGQTVEKFKKENALDNIGGMSKLVELTEVTPVSSNYKNYIEIIIEKYRLRKLLQLGGYIENNVNNNLSSGEVLKLLETGYKSVSVLEKKDDTIKIGDAIMNRINNLSEQLEVGSESVVSIKTGYPQIDNKTGPLVSGNFVVVGASSGLGKTAFGLNIINNNIQHNKRVLLFSMEMKADEIVDIFIAMHTDVKRDQLNKWNLITEEYTDKINLSKAEGKDVTELEKQREEVVDKKNELLMEIGHQLEGLLENNLFINDSSSLSIEMIQQRLMELTLSEPIDLVIVDHIGLMKGLKGQTTTDRISYISRSLKEIAGTFNCPIIALTQLLSKQIEDRPDKRPLVKDIKNSSNIAEDANIILLLDRPLYWEYKSEDDDAPNEQPFDIYITKNRKGKLGKVNLEMNMEKQLITDSIWE